MSSDAARDARAMLDAWRERGADRLDPLRFHFIEALARRTAGHSGDARRLLDERLSKLLQTYEEDAGNAVSKADSAGDAARPGEPRRGPLAELIAYIAGQAPSDGASPLATDAATDVATDVATEAARQRSSYPELLMIDYFRETWSTVSTNRRLRQSREQVPENAGPLNSNSLVHRSLSLMLELSPGYLRQFLSYVDALSWMEQMTGESVATGKDAHRAGNARKGARGKQR